MLIFACIKKNRKEMKKYALFVVGLCLALSARAQVFEDYFADKTLRVDYLFVGDADEQAICLDECSALPSWAGRRHRLGELPLQGNGQVILRDIVTGTVIYCTSFSSLFQEWLETDEARQVKKGFENTVLLPFPLKPAEVEITLFTPRREVRATLRHTIDPGDVLIRRKGTSHVTPHRYLLESGDPADCIDVAILAEGYTKAEMEAFHNDARIACESLFSHEPFRHEKDRFNIVAVASASEDSGVSVPRLAQWKRTAFGSHFSTFYSDRYLTTSNVKTIHDLLAGIPYEHIIILANTDEYGGGGIYNSYTLTTARHPQFAPVVVHEFGHSFGGLADEYFYDDDVMAGTYPLDTEPWEPNITTLKRFSTKWEDMLQKDTPVPTAGSDAKRYPVGVYEGGGYSSKGIYRSAEDCRMRTNSYPAFCPVCQRALQRIIDFYVNE